MNKSEMLHIRVSPEQKMLLHQAAAICEMSMSSFVLATAVERAVGEVAVQRPVDSGDAPTSEPELVDTTSKGDQDWRNYMVFYSDALVAARRKS